MKDTIAYELERPRTIEKELKCKFIRINPDVENYDTFVEIGKIYNQVIESTKELTKK